MNVSSSGINCTVRAEPVEAHLHAEAVIHRTSPSTCSGRTVLWALRLHRALLAIAGTLTIVAARAETPDRWFTISQGSYHFKNQSQYNQDNPGFGFEWTVKNPWVHDTRLAGGRFFNSDRRYSNYWGVIATPFRLLDGAFNVQAGALVGTINGYPRAYNGGYFPLVAPMLSLQYGAAGANIFIIPPFKGIPATAALQLKVGF